MNKLKSVISVVLVLLLMLTFTGCLHKQNEIAVEIGNTKFTAAQYSYALFNADSEARALVDEQLAKDETKTTDTQVDYYSQKIDDTDFVTWVENRAIETLSKFAAYEQLFTEAGLTLTDEEKAEVKSYAEYYYSYYQAMMEPNGIGQETYTKMLAYDNYSSKYFSHLYGKEGSKAIPAEDINKAFSESYRVVLILQTDITQSNEEEIAKAKENLEKYKKDLVKGKSIVDAYNEFNGLTEETEKQGTGTPIKEKLEAVSILSDPDFDSNYGVEFWKDIKDIEAGKAEVLEATEGSTKYLRLVYVVNTEKDDTPYVDEMDMSIRWALKAEEYESDISAYAAGMKVVKHKYAMSAFDVKKISYGE